MTLYDELINDPLPMRAVKIVEEQFALAKDYGVEARTRLEALLSTLQALGIELKLIPTDVNLADLNYTVPPFAGERPIKPIIEFNVGSKPTKGNFKNVDLSDLNTPDISSLSITRSNIDSAVIIYSSSLLTALQTRLLADIQVDIDRVNTETNKWSRARARELLTHNDILDKIRAEWSQSNLPMPDGALTAAIEVENVRYANLYDDRSKDIAIYESDLAVKIRDSAVTHAVQLEQVLMGFVQTTQQRIFEASQATVNAQLQTYNIEMAKYRMMTDIYVAVSNVRLAQAKNYIDIFVAEITAYRTELEAEVARIDAILKNFTAEIEAYRADVAVYQALSSVEIEILRSQLQLATSRAELYLKNADMQIREYETVEGLKIEIVKAMGSVVAQEVAGILSSIQARASMSREDSARYSETHDYTEK